MIASDLHIVREFAFGIGHIEARDGRLLVSYYGRTVTQGWADTVREARRLLSTFNREASR